MTTETPDVRWIETEYVASSHNQANSSLDTNLSPDPTTTTTTTTEDDENDSSDDDGSSNLFTQMFSDSSLHETTHAFPLPSNKEPNTTIKLIGRHPSTGQTLSSTGLTLWRASPQLCDFIIHNKTTYITNKNVIELGAGLGLTSILVSRLGCECIVSTDGDSDTLKGLRDNIKLNQCSDNVKAIQLIWGGDNASTFMTANNSGFEKFDTILGSDIIYVTSVIKPLFETVNILLSDKTGSAFILSYARRNVKIDSVLEEARVYGFDVFEPVGEEGCYVFLRK